MLRLHVFFALFLAITYAQGNEALTPTITPSFFRTSEPITVVYDVSGTPLASLSDAYAWVWLPNATSVNAKWNVNPASSDLTKANNAKFTKSIVQGRTLFTLTFKPSDFFAADISGQTRMGILLKGNDWANGQTTDHLIDFWDGTFQLRLISPTATPLFVADQQVIAIKAETPADATFKTFVNNILVNEASSLRQYAFNYTVVATNNPGSVKVTATSGTTTKEVAFNYVIPTPSPLQARPAGIIDGINYNSADPTRVTLCLWAPAKTSVYALGDFNDWEVSPAFLMKRDGERFWIELQNLTPGIEYGFQYLVNESLRVADPYADKILDPDDKFIPSTTYANIKPYPAKALSTKWYENRVSVFQTAQTPYVWRTTNYQPPAKENLVVYEVLLRDFFAAEGARNYQSLIDTLGYLKRLGINAIELMPIMEFNGNKGWGYNPTFMFAPDKYYGTKNKLKELVDICHAMGIAVILDIAMNHQDVPNTYAAMYFDFNQFRPVNNPWFNATATHPFNVFFDMNHESAYTKKYLDTVNYYWLNEYKVDGYRFDLSKGFTQKNSGSDVGAWSAYDASRVALLKRMADKIWAHSPKAYVILEHLGENNEERELSMHRASEGKGMLLWAKLTDQYNQNTMGYTDNSSIANVYHKNKSWTYPHLLAYMESHDEERLMYKNVAFGKEAVGYNVKDKPTALRRMQAAFATFLTIPGPKMMWQFGELGFDYSINRCENGTINNDCRLSEKPVVWNYLQEENRMELFTAVSDLLRLRKSYTIFSKGEATFNESIQYIKQITLKNSPYTSKPADSTQMNVQIVANFDVVQNTVLVNFPHTGVWYDYANGGRALTVTQVPQAVPVGAGAYSLFTDVPIQINVVTSVADEYAATAALYPNPTTGIFVVPEGSEVISIRDSSGQAVSYAGLGDVTWWLEAPAGLYLVTLREQQRRRVVKLLKL